MPKVTEEHLEAKRSQILYAAVACFARDGFHRTTMSDIAAMAGISDGLAYRYFSGKDQIIEEVVRLGTETRAAIETADDGDAMSMLGLLLRSSFGRFSMTDRETVVNLRFRSWGEANDNPDIRDQVVKRWERNAEVTDELVAKAQAEGHIASDLDPRAITRVMDAIHDGLDAQWAFEDEIDIDACRDVVTALFNGRFRVATDEDR